MYNKRNEDDPRYKGWRKAVLHRDKHKCQMPGCISKRRLQIHHIQRWADASLLRFEVENAITLCASCHYMIRNKEHNYAELFRNIVSKNSAT